MSEPIFLGALASELGAPVDLEALRTPANGDILKALAENGVRRFRESAEPCSTLAARAVQHSLERWRGDPAEIDFVISCSQAFGRSPARGPGLLDLCGDVDLSHSPRVSLNMGGCANFIPAVRLARALIRGEGMRNILVVTADQCESPEARLSEHDIALFSDGAASCVVSRTPDHADFAVQGVGQFTNMRVAGLDRSAQRPRIVMLIAAGMRAAVKAGLSDAGLAEGAVDHLITTTVRRDMARLVAQQARADPDRVFMDTLPEIAHAYSADILINLEASADWRSRMGLARGDPFLALALSRTAWGALVISAL